MFYPEPVKRNNAIVVSFDLCGFSEFCRQPDAHASITRFVAQLFEEVNGFFKADFEKIRDWFVGEIKAGKIHSPDFIKFTGDGAIMIWLKPDGQRFDDDFCTALVAVMRALQDRIKKVVPDWEKEWQVHGLPQRARFGIAKGVVFTLYAKGDNPSSGLEDYVGYCINLAVRLQNHCPEVGFLVHGPLHPHLEGLRTLTAKNIKGGQMEPVLAFETDLARVPVTTRKKKFNEEP